MKLILPLLFYGLVTASCASSDINREYVNKDYLSFDNQTLAKSPLTGLRSSTNSAGGCTVCAH